MSFNTLVASFEIHLFEISVCASAVLVGTIIGWVEIYRQYRHIKVDKHEHLIQIAGTWTTFILIFIIFASKYFFGYELSTDPALKNQTWFEFSMLAVE